MTMGKMNTTTSTKVYTKAQLTAWSQELYQFLLPYTKLWSNELLNLYPHDLEVIPPKWLEELRTLSETELYDFDSKRPVAKLENSELQKIVNHLQILTHIEPVAQTSSLELEDWAWVGVKNKKQHEIEKIVPVLKNLKSKKPFGHVIDIGGGVGHLARILAHYQGIESYSLDREKSFQKSGEERAQKYRKLPVAKNLHFINLTFGDKKDESELRLIANEKAFILGLHTCGNLANELIKTSLHFQTLGLLSFGCCYHKLVPDKEFPTSEFYRQKHLPFNQFALTLATRAHGAISFDDYITKKQVKLYRFALHLWLYHKHDIKDQFSVGENNTRDYHQAFSSYAHQKLRQLNLPTAQKQELDDFYQAFYCKSSTQDFYLGNLIRWQFGRALEVYLLIDRALFLIEQGMEVSLATFFDESLSPRNIGILATR